MKARPARPVNSISTNAILLAQSLQLRYRPGRSAPVRPRDLMQISSNRMHVMSLAARRVESVPGLVIAERRSHPTKHDTTIAREGPSLVRWELP